jgi:hypothetical protein
MDHGLVALYLYNRRFVAKVEKRSRCSADAITIGKVTQARAEGNKKGNDTTNPIWVGLTSRNHTELDSKTVMLFSRIGGVNIQVKPVVSEEGETGKGWHRNELGNESREDEMRRDENMGGRQ